MLLRPLVSSLLRPRSQTLAPAPMVRPMSGGGHSDADWKFWKNLFVFAACPVIVLAHVSAFVLPEASDLEPPPFVQYDHLRIRTKKFPWGDGNHSLIHNAHTNALPDGFEHEH